MTGSAVLTQYTRVTDVRTTELPWHIRATVQPVQGGPIKKHILRYHIFAATTDIIMRFLLKCSEITAEKTDFLNKC